MNVVINGLIINYQDIGKKTGKAILFIHGWGDDSSSFESMSRHLSSAFRCISVDLPGFGRSETPANALGLSDFSDIIDKFLHKIQVKPEIIIGHSNGGAIAVKALADKKLKPKKLVLLASSGIRTGQKLKKTIYKVLAKPAKIGLAVIPNEKSESIKKKVYGRIGSDYLVSEHMKETFKNIVGYDISSDARKLDIPVLLIYGTNDTSTPLEMGEKLNKLIPGSELKTVKGAGHFIHHDNPELVNKYIEDFLR